MNNDLLELIFRQYKDVISKSVNTDKQASKAIALLALQQLKLEVAHNKMENENGN